MHVIINIMILAAGFVGLIKGADLFVDGSATLARKFKVPGVIIGLTVVAMGTSAPELAVSLSAALQGSNEIALSNVVGSNLFNLLCVLGICSIIHPIPVERAIIKRDFPLSIIITVFLLLSTCGTALISGSVFHSEMADQAGMVSRWIGILLLVAFVIYMLYLIRDARKNPTEDTDTPFNRSLLTCLLYIVLGLVLIVAGGEAVVYSAKEIARAAGMTETLIGLTIVAFGTSLPELVTSIIAARKGETGMALGNVIGSNIFNIMLILSLSSAIHPIGVNVASVYDMLILIGASILAFVIAAARKKLGRGAGLLMTAIYAANVIFAILR